MRMRLFVFLLAISLTGCMKVDDTPAPTLTALENDTDSTNEFVCELPIGAEFPGGMKAWQAFLQKNLVYPQEAIDAAISGTVSVAFNICIDGSLCDVTAMRGPEALREAAVQTIKKSPKWIPASIHDCPVAGSRTQPIVFRLEEE